MKKLSLIWLIIVGILTIITVVLSIIDGELWLSCFTMATNLITAFMIYKSIND